MSAPTQTSASVKQPEKCAKTYRLSPYQPSIQSTHNESIAPSKTNPSIASGGVIVTQQPSVVRAFIDSFRQNDIQKNATRSGSRRAGRRPNNGNHRGDERQYDVESAVEATAMSPLARKLNGRHLQMIAIGGSIGTGLFVGSGAALAQGGPASLLIAFCLIGIMMYCTVQALGEMAVLFPVAGSFSAYATRFLDPAWGFAMGWNYALQWLVVLPLEIVAASLTIEFWSRGRANHAVWVTVFLVLIIGLNLFGIKGYGEAEFVFSIIKIIAIVGFIILGIVINLGGTPKQGFIGAKYWSDPGAFNNGFKGLCSVFVVAAFAFAGTELVGLAAAETANPRKSLPSAVKQIFWRIFLFYIVSIIVLGFIVPYNDHRLIGRPGSTLDSTASPFVVAIQSAGIDVLPSIMNAVIMIAVLSVGNSSIYGSSRTLAALAEQKQAPRIFAYVDRKGRPIVGIAAAGTVGLLAYIAGGSKEGEVLSWLLAISGLSAIFTWASICVAHIRFRKGWKVQGHSLDELAFRSQPGVVGSWIGFGFNLVVIVAQFWIGFAPIGWRDNTPGENVYNFFSAFLAIPVTVAFYIGYKLWYRTAMVRSHNMDLHTGIRELNLAELAAEEKLERQSWSRWKRAYKVFC